VFLKNIVFIQIMSGSIFFSKLNSTNIVKISYYSDLLPILDSKNLNLHDLNLALGENDSQRAAVRNFYF
jgi:hypothetical protein